MQGERQVPFDVKKKILGLRSKMEFVESFQTQYDWKFFSLKTNTICSKIKSKQNHVNNLHTNS